jgi:hypothetical protein
MMSLEYDPTCIALYSPKKRETFITRSGETINNPAYATVESDRAHARMEYLKSYAWNIWKNVLFRRLADHAPSNYARAFF